MNYVKIKQCRICKSKNLVSVLNLGNHYLSDFRDDLSKPDSFPLDLLLCEDCSLAQLSVTVDRNLMYHDGYGYRSGTNELIRENLKWIVKIAEKFVPAPKSWLDIACNDATFLNFFDKNKIKVGIDPANNILPKNNLNNFFFENKFFSFSESKKLKKKCVDKIVK